MSRAYHPSVVEKLERFNELLARNANGKLCGGDDIEEFFKLREMVKRLGLDGAKTVKTH